MVCNPVGFSCQNWFFDCFGSKWILSVQKWWGSNFHTPPSLPGGSILAPFWLLMWLLVYCHHISIFFSQLPWKLSKIRRNSFWTILHHKNFSLLPYEGVIYQKIRKTRKCHTKIVCYLFLSKFLIEIKDVNVLTVCYCIDEII